MDDGRTLAAFVAETPYEAIPSSVIETIRVCILDNLAGGFAGAPHAWSRIVAEMVHESTVGTCSMFGRVRTASASGAALFNGVCIGGFETDHVYSPGSAHPGAAVFPAALAAAEMTHLDGRGFLAAIALGYEALCRVGAAATRAVEEERGFHGPATNAPIGGAFGAGRALALDAETLLHAVGVAASHGGGLLEFSREGAMTKRLHVGRGSQLGLESALLAQRGFTGPSRGIEGEHGFLRVYSPEPRPELLLAGLGEEWLLLGVSLKAFPCHVAFHPVVDAIQRWRQSGDFDARDIEGVRVRSAHRMMSARFAERSPSTVLGAQTSLAWAIAVSLLHDPAAPSTWGEDMLGDARVRALASRVELLHEAPPMEGVAAEVVVRTGREERTLAATDWDGAPTRPYTLETVAAKFRRYTAGQASDSRIEEIVERVGRLEREDDLAAVGALIRAE